MTTREEYAEAAKLIDDLAGLAAGPGAEILSSAARVLRALADGAVLCENRGRSEPNFPDVYSPLDPQP